MDLSCYHSLSYVFFRTNHRRCHVKRNMSYYLRSLFNDYHSYFNTFWILINLKRLIVNMIYITKHKRTNFFLKDVASSVFLTYTLFDGAELYLIYIYFRIYQIFTTDKWDLNLCHCVLICLITWIVFKL